MPIEPVTFYRAVCDGCGYNITEHGEFSAWAEASTAEDDARDVGAVSDDGRVACADCRCRYLAPISGVDDDLWDAEDELLDAGDNEAMTRLLAAPKEATDG